MSESRWIVPLSDIEIDDELLNTAHEAISSGWWSMGPRVADFEAAFAEFCETRHAFAVASGTAALHLALLAIGAGPGDEIVLPSLNFVAAANTVTHVGATPVFCDVLGENDLNLDPRDLEAAITPATKAVLVLHYGGFPCDIDAVSEIARRFDLAVVEDAAHAPGARATGRPCGSIGSVGCFSFFSNKNLPVGEGGMVVTKDPGLGETIKLLRSHGMTTLTWDRHRGHANAYDVALHGFNYRLDELRAALGMYELERLPARNGRRAQLTAVYRSALHGVEGLVVPFSDRAAEEAAHHLAAVVLPGDVARSEIRASLDARGIQTSVHYPPIHRFSCFERLGVRRALPVTDRLAERILTLPLYPHMTDAQQRAVIDGLLSAIRSARR